MDKISRRDESGRSEVRSKIIRVAKVGLFLLLIFTMMFGIFLWRFASREASREELLRFRNQIEVGYTKEQIKSVFVSGNYKHLELLEFANDAANTHGNVWHVSTLLEFGASNWVLWLYFSDSRMTSMKVRLEDSENIKPHDAPPDIGTARGVPVSCVGVAGCVDESANTARPPLC